MFNISNGKQLNFHSVSFDNIDRAFVPFDTFLVSHYLNVHCLSVWLKQGKVREIQGLGKVREF